MKYIFFFNHKLMTRILTTLDCVFFQLRVPGYIRDVTGSYDVPYHVIGCGILLDAGLLLLVRLVHRWETRHLTKRGQDTKAVVA